MLETWRALRILVEKYRYDQRHFAIKRAVDLIFSYQTHEGDIRGILSIQYTPYYMGAMMENIIHNLCQKDAILPDKTRLFSHVATGMVLRAYAAHPKYRHSEIAWKAVDIIKKRFFGKDTFTSRQAPSYWMKFQYPYGWIDLLSVMDSLEKIGFHANDEDIQKVIRWFFLNQNGNGSSYASYGGKNDYADEWVSLAVCRILKEFPG